MRHRAASSESCPTGIRLSAAADRPRSSGGLQKRGRDLTTRVDASQRIARIVARQADAMISTQSEFQLVKEPDWTITDDNGWNPSAVCGPTRRSINFRRRGYARNFAMDVAIDQDFNVPSHARPSTARCLSSDANHT